jgi:hypothetical protein
MIGLRRQRAQGLRTGKRSKETCEKARETERVIPYLALKNNNV